MKLHPALGETASEARLRRALRRNAFIGFATGLLIAAAAVFAATVAVPAPGFWVGLARAGAEAALVGGLADWFAVTALFRHPLGLPFPRTAVIPKNKDRIGEGLGDFVERNFLAPELLAEKLRELAPVARVAGWLADPAHAESLAQRIAETLPPLLRSASRTASCAPLRRALVPGAASQGGTGTPALGRIVAVRGPERAL